MTSKPEPKTRAEKFLDATIFAPLGALLQRHAVFDDLATAGRKQIAFSQSLGKAVLQRLSGTPKADADNSPAATAKETAAGDQAAPTVSDAPSAAPATAKTATPKTPAKTTPVKKPSAKKTPAKKPPAAATGEIQGYGEMTAREIIAMVGSCTPAELAWIRKTEPAGKNRVTIMRALG